ncbi:MAG TPA: pseudouridine synthase [Candidatus Limnocylindria bacterium]|jgi:16S rRNA pseudouridine516 synthase|nr:pseudouridine synthase [Candidatus Limnocylindria bacterium]
MRLDQIMSRYGYCSRGESRGWLKAGRIRVDGVIIKEPEFKASPWAVTVDQAPIEAPEGLLALLHKPAGYVCSHDPKEGPRVYDLIPERWLERNPPVATIGRLDKDATGVLLLTDQGPLIHNWTSPRHKVAKVYEVVVDRPFPDHLVELFAAGTLLLEGESHPVLPAILRVTSPTQAQLEITEGKYHQVKRMFASQGCAVLSLHRSRFGDYHVTDLPVGQWRLLPLP